MAQDTGEADQGAHNHDHEHAPRHFHQVYPVFLVDDVNATAEYYRDVFGFEIVFLYGDPAGYATVARDHVAIHLSRVQPAGVRNSALAGGAPGANDAYVFVNDVDDLYEELKQRGASMLSEPRTYDWGLREFMVEDRNGYHLIFGSDEEEPSQPSAP